MVKWRCSGNTASLNLWPRGTRALIIPASKAHEERDAMACGQVRIIVNPISGSGRDPRFIPELARHLTLRGFSVDVRPTCCPGHARDLACETPDEARCVVSVGGDGTHREVLAGLLGRPVPVCVVPLGTENVLARTFRLTRGLEATVRRIQAGRPVAVDLGLANDHPFMMFSGIGFDAAVTRAVHEKRRGRILREAYYATIARLWWRYVFPRLAVTVDGRQVADDAGFVVVANTPLYADGLRIAPGAVGDDGLLDVVCFRTRSRWQILRFFLLTRMGRHLGYPQVVAARGRRIEVACPDGPALVQTDGDAILTTPVRYAVAPKAVRLLVDP
jgi:YegS/Rv2252/BmrU family lipid kinase